MPSDAHAHLYELLRLFPGAEGERRRLGVSCAASAWRLAEFEAQEALARQARSDGASPLFLCFAVHPQLPAVMGTPVPSPSGGYGNESLTLSSIRESLSALETLAGEGRLAAIGETGFDLYNEAFKNTESLQDELFQIHLEIALDRNLPLVLHIRRAMHKVFFYNKALRRLPALIFHSYSGTGEDGVSLIKRGINAYFSFGSPIILNHKTAMTACARLPPERLLLETDAPYQPLRGAAFSHWRDLEAILQGAATLRQEAPEALQAQVDINFSRIWPEC